MSGNGRRTHIVMVPGFGGFDVLGQIFYYAGVTQVLRSWQSTKAPGSTERRTALHYFETLPTAGVRSRALALRGFLEELVFRGIVEEGDRVCIVGHSTGGLDVRQLLVDLDPGFAPALRTVVEPSLVPAEDVLGKIERLVFLSVPQRGTNIADFTRRLKGLIAVAISGAEQNLKLKHAGIFDVGHRAPPTDPSSTKHPQLFLAIQDAVAETKKPEKLETPIDRYAAVLARNAYAELVGWLDGVRTDFFAIDDLSCEAPDQGAVPTPARYTEAVRKQELATWAARKIRSRSYATVGRQPFGDGVRTNAYELLDVALLLKNACSDGAPNTDAVYRLIYGATAAGPFTPFSGEDVVQDGTATRRLEAWENDGIVNTASMLWPHGAETRLVHGDHADIIGHYVFAPPIKGTESVLNRVGHGYDLLGSASGFDKTRFDAIWSDIFEFCAAG